MIAMNSYAKVVELFAFFADDGRHFYEDDYIKLAISVDDNNHPCIAVLNKTDNIIYLDKGTSFVYYNGVPVSLFTNASHTQSKGGMSGGTLNAGSVANALGIGGTIGALLGGVNLGAAATSQSSTTIYEQRVVMLAPHAIYTLYSWDYDSSWNPIYNRLGNGKSIRPRKAGQEWSFEEMTSPIVLQSVLTFSTKEDFSEPMKASVSNYISAVAMGKKDKNVYSLDGYYRFANKTYMQTSEGTPSGLKIGAIVALPVAIGTLIMALTSK